MTHEEKTRLIAEFDGWDYENMSDYRRRQFSTSYDWLIPVWHKFRDLRFEDLKHEFSHSNIKNMIRQELTIGTAWDLFNELAEAIEWYNTTKK